EVDAGGHAAARDPVPVLHDPGGRRLGADEGKQVVIGPVRGGLVALQQAGRAEDQGAGADGRDVFGSLPTACDEVQHFRILDHGGGSLEAARNEQDFELLRYIVECGGGHDRHAAV